MKNLVVLFLLAGMAGIATAATPRPDQLEFRELFRELVETNTSHSAGNCTQAAERMTAHLRAAGFTDAQLHPFGVPEYPKERGIVAILKGSGPAKPVLLLAHLDVVEAKREDWSRDPFTMVEEDGYFYGRGAFDDKGMAAVWVDTMMRLKRAGKPPKRTVKMALTCGEEGGAVFNGADYLARHERDLIAADFALNEFAWGVLDESGKRIAMEVQIGEKTSQDYHLEVTNPGGHSSRPVKNNAIYTLSGGLTRLSGYDFPVRLNDTTRAYFTRMATITGGETGQAMQAIVANPADAAAAARLSAEPRYNALLHTTCVATTLEAGHATNALPQRARANVNCRLFPGDTVAAVRDQLVQAVGNADIKVSVVEPSDPVVPAPPLRADVMQAIEAVTRQFYPGVPVVPVMQAAATDAAYIAPAGIPSYGVSGMFIDPDQSNVHGLNERVRVESLYDGRDFLYALVKRFVD